MYPSEIKVIISVYMHHAVKGDKLS